MKNKQNSNLETVLKNLKEYKKKYYLNRLLRGSIFSLGIILSVFLIFSSLEYTIRFNTSIRSILFFSFVGAFIFVFYRWIAISLYQLFNLNKQISDEEAAKLIGNYFPDIKDKLLNTIQLKKLLKEEGSLINAGVSQKAHSFEGVEFKSAINYKENKRHLKWLAVPAFAIIFVLIFVPQLVTESTTRIINYKIEYIPEAPFAFILENSDLQAFKNEDFKVNLHIEGDALPENVYLFSNGRKIKMVKSGEQNYEYTFAKIQANTLFNFEAAGFSSTDYSLKVVSRPDIKNFLISLDYPSYLKKKNEKLNNTGNLEIPEGTKVKWQINTLVTEEVKINFINGNEEHVLIKSTAELFELDKQIIKSDNYQIALKNKFSKNKDIIQYHIDVIPDKHPEIQLQNFQDTLLYNYAILGGNLSDDYGLTELKLNYKIKNDLTNNEGNLKSIRIPINTDQVNQSFYYKWRLDSLKLQEGEKVEYFLQVWDNDGVNGRKSSRTGIYTFNVPTRKEIKENLDNSAKNTSSKMNKTVQKAQEIKKKIEELDERIKGKKQLKYQDEKLMKELFDKKEELNKEIEQLKEQYKEHNQKRDRFDQNNENIKSKAQQLQKLMDELLDDETKKLYDELKKLLEEKRDISEIQKTLDKLSNKEQNLEKELERTLELFKKMKFDYKMEEVIKDLDELSQKQEDLSKKNLEKNTDNQSNLQEQEKLNQEFKEVEEDIKELKELNQEMQNPNSMTDTSEEEQGIEKDQQKSSENLKNNKKKQAQESQKNAADKMKQLSKKMKDMQSSMEAESMQENLDDLRQIQKNLIKLSFDQEELMKEFRKINQSDPRFIELSQEQLKLKENAKIIEDSLLSLAKRVFQIASFVTREVNEMNDNIDASLGALKERQHAQALNKQQFAMTSMNNLALLLDDVLQQMQQQMADAMGSPKSGKNKQKSKGPSLGDLQKQLNQKIEDLKNSGKSGRQLSEELAKLAAEQEQIRRAVQEMQQKMDKESGGGSNLNDLKNKMEKTESDLVNKQITDETIKRQRDILTRLLESEKSMRERELDEKREGEKAKQQENEVPKEFQEYIKAKEKEIELLKTVPPRLNPYYKNEVNEYFKRVNN
jgi:hypothetical protein